ncbi:MAG: NADH-quinone oxidoreductase subunit M [Candidatus Bathyarchaeota archaeon]|nr:NADH-quinone oxidoreductase subunit M [Candidatus Bathyarchaeota archaeon]MDH5779301.1 NADH-quinone oxidoreductase subunit M [Candidatus Bathyarchaeota archaeon]
MIEHAALLATVIPGIAGILLYAFSRQIRRGVGWMATIAASSSVVMLISMGSDVMEKQGSITFRYAWIPSIKVDFGFLVDTVSFPIALIAAAVSTLCCFYSIKYMEKERDQPAYYANLLLFMTGMIGVILSSNLIQFYLFWELMLIPSYLLIANWGTSKNRLNIAFKYFIFTHIGALSMLLGILAVFSYTKTFNLLELPLVAGDIPLNMVGVIFVMLLIGFLVKMAAFPVHTWLPDAHSEAPTPISAMLSGVMIKCGAYGMARILLTTFGQIVLQASDYLAILGIITIAYGGLMALAQTDIKRLLAYSSISQMGYILFGLGVASELGIMGGLLHIINHAVCKSLLFLCAGIIIHQTGTRDIRRLGGLIGKMPVMGIACLIGVFSLAGTPPLNAFWSEWMIFGGGLAAGKGLITIFAVLSTVITAGYYLWFVWRVFFGPLPKRLNEMKEAPISLRAPVIILATISVLLGVLPGLVLEYIAPAAEYLSSLILGG